MGQGRVVEEVPGTVIVSTASSLLGHLLQQGRQWKGESESGGRRQTLIHFLPPIVPRQVPAV